MKWNPCLKLLRHSDKLKEWMDTGATSSPIGLDIEVTQHCPHKCPHCNVRHMGNVGHADVEMIKRIVGDFVDRGLKGVNMTGGEPLAHPRLPELLRWLKSEGLSIGLFTNLYRLTDEQLEAMAECCSWVRVSVDAGDRETYAKVHGVDVREFDALWERIAKLSARVNTGVGYLIVEHSYADMENCCRLAVEHGAKYINFRPPNGKSAFGIEEIKWLETQYPVAVNWDKLEKTCKGYEKCYGFMFWAVITPDGKLRTCCEKPTDSIIESWTPEVLRAKAESMNLSDCPVTCHMDNPNELLWQLKEPIKDEHHL